MNDYQSQVNKMMLEIIDFFETHKELTETNPILKNHVNELIEEQAKIPENHIVQSYNNTGLYVNKRIAKSEIAELLFRLSSGLGSYAADTDNHTVYIATDKSYTKIMRLSDLRFQTYSRIVSGLLRKHQANIKVYGVSDEDIKTLETKTEDYYITSMLPTEARIKVKIATENIKKQITKCLAILHVSIDNDMQYYQIVNKNLYQLYFLMRRIDDNKTISMSIKGQVCDAESNEPLQHVVVRAKQEIDGKVYEYKKITTAKGNYQFKGLHNGICTLSFTRNYYDSIVVDSAVYHDKYTRVDVQIHKEEPKTSDG